MQLVVAVWIILALVLVAGVGILAFDYANSQNKDWFEPRPKVICWPKDKDTREPVIEYNRVLFSHKEPVLLEQASEDSTGNYRHISLDYYISIPEGYTGIVSLVEDSFSHESVFLRNQVLPGGWQGDLEVDIGNRHFMEPASCPDGRPFVALTIVKQPTSMIVDTTP